MFMSSFSGLSRMARTSSPMRVAPGSCTGSTASPRRSSSSRSSRACVLFPHPSPPSNTMNLPRRCVTTLQLLDAQVPELHLTPMPQEPDVPGLPRQPGMLGQLDRVLHAVEIRIDHRRAVQRHHDV